MYRSEYYLTLSGDIKARYDAKIEIIDVVDPYAIRRAECQLDILQLPNIKMIDLVNYLILTHSYYTGQQLKAYKSLQAFKQYESGSVQEILAKQINQEAFVVISKVQHSQRKKRKITPSVDNSFTGYQHFLCSLHLYIGRLVLWCICESPDDGRPMLRCDSDNCEIQWFHFECVKVSSVPLTWYCNNC